MSPSGPRVYSTAGGEVLTAPSIAPVNDIVAAFLASRGVGPAVEGLVLIREDEHRGLTHLTFQQVIDGRRVHGAYVKATVTARGELLHAIENLAPLPAGTVAAANVGEEAALDSALLHVGLSIEGATAAHVGDVVVFTGLGDFHTPPTVEAVLFVDAAGALAPGFLVETWSESGNLLHHTLIDGDGRVVSTELRTASDRYNVFTNSPWVTPQAVVNGPGAGNAASPIGWLSGSQVSLHIAGNNANAYLDVDANNRVDRGGTAVANGDFLTAADLTSAPSTTQNREVGVQNLFYLNNVVHDILYPLGFDEAAGNFQEDNFGKGGAGSDSVNAEAQDGSGLDNANFSTPSDGRNPRMQMFLWSGAGPDAQVVTASGIFAAAGAGFGPALTSTGTSGALAVGNDGAGVSASDLCEASTTSLTGKVVIVDRGACNFTVKVMNAQSAGAAAVIVANNAGDDYFAMGGTERRIRIPSAMVGQSDGTSLKALAGIATTVRRHPNPPLQVDASLDSDIVYHEYGHGLTWRMIGGMSGPLAGAVGEGASDVLAMFINGDPIIAEYSASNAGGIRRNSYEGYPRTYADVTGEGVHNDGEIYAAAMWRMIELYLQNGYTSQRAFSRFISGMNYTPSTPAFEDMRDGMLQAIAADSAAGALETCLVWQAFAQYGIGDGADGVATNSGVTITESFALPPNCQSQP